jgi:nicotinamidase-related amidase
MDTSLARSRSVLLLVDFVNPLRFDGAEDIAPAALAAARATASLKQLLDRRGVPAIYANDNFGGWRSDFRKLVERTQAQGGVPGEIARLLAPGERDLTLLKPRHSAFHATPLELLLAQMHARSLIVVGLAADICVQFTAMDAYVRGFELHVPSDCTAAESARHKDHALAWMARVLSADTAPSDDLAHQLPTPRRGGRRSRADAANRSTFEPRSSTP